LLPIQDEDATAANRREIRGNDKIEIQNASLQATLGNRACLPRPEVNVLKYAAILSQRHFAIGDAIQVIELHRRPTAMRDST
jgi:hypothetical protein